jgi:DnaJ-class molecular chaperone
MSHIIAESEVKMICPNCNGSGGKTVISEDGIIFERCNTCGGIGTVPDEEPEESENDDE